MLLLSFAKNIIHILSGKPAVAFSITLIFS